MTRSRSAPTSPHIQWFPTATVALTTMAAFACGPKKTVNPPVLPATAPAHAPSEHQSPKPRYWRGAIVLPGDQELGFSVAITPAPAHQPDARVEGTIDIPQQNLRAAPLTDVALDDSTIRFSLGSANASWEGKFGPNRAVTCSFRQHGHSLACTLEEIDEAKYAQTAAPHRRPQTPQPPYPYTAIEVEYDNIDAGVHLAGTLTIPPGPGPHPAVLLISGSGAQDRDETIFDHKPFFVLADHLTRNHVAVLRVDDRGVGGSTGNPRTSTSEDFASDVSTGIDFLAQHPHVDPKRIGLLGHSEGGIIAPLVATRRKDVAFVVMLAPPGVLGSKIIVEQAAVAAQAAGLSPEKVAETRRKQAELLTIVSAPTDEAETRAKIRAYMLAEAGDTLPEEERDKAIALAVESLVSPWYRWFIRHDPAPVLAKVPCPVLAVFGEKDLQVTPAQNLNAVKLALAKSPSNEVTLRELPGLNHLFQTAQTGQVSEYANIEQTLAPELLEVVSSWVKAKSGDGP